MDQQESKGNNCQISARKARIPKGNSEAWGDSMSNPSFQPDFYPLPSTEAEKERELDELIDVLAENAPLGYMREFRIAGVRLGHA